MTRKRDYIEVLVSFWCEKKSFKTTTSTQSGEEALTVERMPKDSLLRLLVRAGLGIHGKEEKALISYFQCKLSTEALKIN